jgi:hypothetical protein
MAVEPEDDELLLDQPADEGGDADDQQDDQEELEITFGDEAAPASGEAETGLARHLREEIRRRDKEIADLRKAQPAPQKIEVGPRPTMDRSDIDYDEEKFVAELEAWNARKAQAEQAESQAERQQREANEAWQNELRQHEAKRSALKFPDAQDAEEVAVTALDQVQQAVIVKVADNSALVLYALGKNPAKLGQLSQIKDPLKLAAAVAKLEGTLKVTARRKAPEPEEIASGSARVTQGKDPVLERLEKEAARTGDRSRVIAHKASQRTSGK